MESTPQGVEFIHIHDARYNIFGREALPDKSLMRVATPREGWHDLDTLMYKWCLTREKSG